MGMAMMMDPDGGCHRGCKPLDGEWGREDLAELFSFWDFFWGLGLLKGGKLSHVRGVSVW